MIITNLPSPSTLQLNRFYTREFFELAKRILGRDGILTISCPGSPSYLSEKMMKLLREGKRKEHRRLLDCALTPGLKEACKH